ncbi:MAG: 4-hydroxy-tetrahydrodipicolinate synthase [Bacteroidales bacterium]|nr:4-hydroxy-tetrahydrodipicolinate synthase [Bacteroidales bacterium]
MTDHFIGTGVALVTPFNTDKSIDYRSLEKIVHHVIDGGIDYIVTLGTTGESVTLSKEERKKVISKVLQYSNHRVPVVVGMGSNNTMQLVKTIQSTEFEGIDAVLSVVPYYNKPTQKGMYEHFSAIAKACPLPVILYNVPGRTGSNLNADTVLQLAADHKNIIGVKEASGNLRQIMEIIKNKPDDFRVISGDDAITLSMIQLGGSGVISVIANAHPAHFTKMVKAALGRNYELANTLHFRLLDYFDALFEEGNPAGVKAALEILGLCKRDVRLPLVAASNTLLKKLTGILDTLN